MAVVFAAMSRHNFYLREHIIKFILEQGKTPLCAFMMYSYFLLDTVDRDQLIKATNDILEKSDELWVFGEVTEGVQEEINRAQKINLPIKYFEIESGTLKFEEKK
jgi:hypothetical protein